MNNLANGNFPSQKCKNLSNLYCIKPACYSEKSVKCTYFYSVAYKTVSFSNSFVWLLISFRPPTHNAKKKKKVQVLKNKIKPNLQPNA